MARGNSFLVSQTNHGDLRVSENHARDHATTYGDHAESWIAKHAGTFHAVDPRRAAGLEMLDKADIQSLEYCACTVAHSQLR